MARLPEKLSKQPTPTNKAIEELRARQEKRESKPLSEKARQDQATLEALDATKH